MTPARVPERGAAWLDLAQGLTGLALGLFMWVHMLLVSSILLGKDAMYAVARAFEGQYLFGEPHPALVSGVVAVVAALFAVHALCALGRIPAGYREYHVLLRHARGLRHADTWLWLVQVATGLLLLFLASVHLYTMFMHPADIGPYESADRFVTGGMWPLYLVLLFAVELHGGIGLYRLALKWGWVPAHADPRVMRRRLSRLKWTVTAFFLMLGLATFAAYMKIGIEHRDRAGERYVPTSGASGALSRPLRGHPLPQAGEGNRVAGLRPVPGTVR
jgi:fumarate reductase subunit C